MILRDTLKKYAASGNTLHVGIVGAGQMGEGLACQIERIMAMRVSVIADVRKGRSKEAFLSARVPDGDIIETEDLEPALAAMAAEQRVACSDATLLNHLPIDIVVEATGLPDIGAAVAWNAILARKHVLQMNVETDATVGYLLNKQAKAAGVVYTLTAGDEPGTAMEIYDFATTLGFEVICMGKGKNNILDRSANPDTLAEKARKQQMNPKMLASFVDGTKTMVEMTSLGNAIGFIPDCRGMHGPEVSPDTLKTVFVPEAEGGVLSKKGVVEFGIGVAPGVFAIITSDHPKVMRDMTYLSMGPGPYFSLYRPYHLTSLETPVSIIRAAINGESTIATEMPPCCETVTYAKKDLKVGDTIDALGGYTVYGMIEEYRIAEREQLLPIGLAPSARLIRNVPEGQPIQYSDVELNEDQLIVTLRRLQDQMLEGEK